MAHFNTHVKFIDSLGKLKLPKEYVVSGAVFPDIMQYVNFKNSKSAKDEFAGYWHFPEPESKNGLKFAREMLKLAKTKEEKAFAYGVLSHFIVDVNVHGVIYNALKLDMGDHVVLEFYQAFENLNHEPIKKLYCCKDLLIRTFKKLKPKDYELYLKQIEEVNSYKLFKYRIICDRFMRKLITKRYSDKPESALLHRIVFYFVRKGYKKTYGVDINKLFYPYRGLKKHLEQINDALDKAGEDLEQIKF